MGGHETMNEALRRARGWTPTPGRAADESGDEPASRSIDAGAHGPPGSAVDMNELLREGARRRLRDD